jgi:WD40 repeat protein
LTDFGLAKRLDGAGGPTQSGTTPGTPSYMAPEQALGKKEVGPATDVYGLGAILYELLTGRPPFRGATVLETLTQVWSQDPVPPTRLQPAMPRDLETICLKCLAKDPRKRYPTAADLADDLGRFRNGEPIRARPVGAWERGVKWARRRPALAALLGVSGAAAVGMAVLLAALWYGAEQRADLGRTVKDLRQDIAKAEGQKEVLRAEVAGKRAEADRLGDEIRVKRLEAEVAGDLAERVGYVAGIRLVGEHLARADFRQASECLSRLEPRAGGQDRRGFEWHYLQGLGRLDLRTIQTHTRSTAANYGDRLVAFSPDGRYLASGSDGGKGRRPEYFVTVWEAATGKPERILPHGQEVTAVAFSPDGMRLAAAGDKAVTVWDWRAGTEVRGLRQVHARGATAVAFSPDGRYLASASVGGVVRVWDLEGGKEAFAVEPGVLVDSVAFDPDGRRLAAAGRDGAVRVWSLPAGGEVHTLKGHAERVASVAFSRDGKRLAAAGPDGVVFVWDAATGRFVRPLPGHAGDLAGVAFSPDGQRLAAAGFDRTVKVWDAGTGRPLLTLQGHTAPVTTVAFSPDGRRLATASRLDRTVKVWDATRSQECLALEGHSLSVAAVAFGTDGRLASATIDPAVRGERVPATVKVWDTAAGQAALTLEGHSSVALSPDGGLLAAASNPPAGPAVTVWEAKTGRPVHTLRGDTVRFTAVAFSPDGKRLAAGGWDRKVWVWVVKTGERSPEFGGHAQPITAVAFSPDGRLLAAGSGNYQAGAVKVWDAVTGREVVTPEGVSDHVFGLAFSPDGRRLAVAGFGKAVKIWELAAGRWGLTLEGHDGRVRGVAFSPDGERLASAGEDRAVKFWDAIIGQEVLTLRGHGGVVNGVAFSPDGQQLASAGADGTVQVRTAARRGARAR